MWPDSSYDSPSTTLSYYDDLITYVYTKDNSAISVLNPGSAYDPNLLLNAAGTVYSVLYESKASSWNPLLTCRKLRGIKYGAFSKGPWCQYVPTSDGVETLKTDIDTGVIAVD